MPATCCPLRTHRRSRSRGDLPPAPDPWPPLPCSPSATESNRSSAQRRPPSSFPTPDRTAMSMLRRLHLHAQPASTTEAAQDALAAKRVATTAFRPPQTKGASYPPNSRRPGVEGRTRGTHHPSNRQPSHHPPPTIYERPNPGLANSLRRHLSHSNREPRQEPPQSRPIHISRPVSGHIFPGRV